MWSEQLLDVSWILTHRLTGTWSNSSGCGSISSSLWVCETEARRWWSGENRCVRFEWGLRFECVWRQGVCEKQEEAGESHWACRLHYIWVIVFKSWVAPEQQVREYLGFDCDTPTRLDNVHSASPTPDISTWFFRSSCGQIYLVNI